VQKSASPIEAQISDGTTWREANYAGNLAKSRLWVNRVDLAASALCPVIGPFQARRFALEGGGPDVIQAPKQEPRIMRDERSDHEWDVIKPMLPNKPRKAACVNLWLTAAAG
jgi:hypothetical protein